MVLRVDVVDAALEAAYGEERPRIVLLSPTGPLLDDPIADELVAEPHVALLCGRYEGFDDRVHQHLADDELSIGRYVLAGGELPAMVVADVLMRKLPGALGHADSAAEDSFGQVLEGMPEYPHFTRPASYRGWEVPEILKSGDHEKVRAVAAGAEPRPCPEVRSRRRVATIPQPRGSRFRVRRFFLAR